MIRTTLLAGAWAALVGLSAVAALVGGVVAVFPAGVAMLLPLCFALLGAAAAFALDEPAHLVVDVTPTGRGRRTALRAVGLLAPLLTGTAAVAGAVGRGTELPWDATGLALAGHLAVGFGLACAARTRTGEPGAVVGAVVAMLLTAPLLVPHLPAWVRTLPLPPDAASSSNHLWLVVLACCGLLVLAALADGARPVPLRRRS